MARVPEDTRPTNAQWLIHARKAAGFSNAKKFLAAVRAQEGSAPSYSSYAQWESGEVTPRPEGLALIRRFHKARKTVVPDPAPDLAAAIVMLTRELAAMREERTVLWGRLDELSETVDRLASGALGGEDRPAPGAQPVPPAPTGSGR